MSGPRQIPPAATGSVADLISTASPTTISSSTGPPRRATMTEVQQNERRASIQLIMKDPSIPPLEKRRRVQNLMDGRRASYDCPVNPYLEMKAKLAAERQQQEDVQPDESRGNFHRRRSSDGATMYDAMEIEPMGTSMDHILSDVAPSSNGVSEEWAKKHPYQSSTTTVPMAGCSDQSIPHQTSEEFSRRAVESAPTCTHYDRKCSIVSPCCGATFGCRICHDDCPILPPLLDPDGFGSMDHDCPPNTSRGKRKFQKHLRTNSMPMNLDSEGPPEHHNIDRFAIKEIICRECFTRQSSKTNLCVNCNAQFGEYHCAICNLWMSNEERPYHCPDCGFCRVGGGENFRHCQDCGMCIDKELFDGHNCQVGKFMSNCPVCQEDLFSSRDASHELPCGHAIHWHCFRELASHDSRCPCCKKTAETHERMKPTWDAMAMGIALQPVPPELAKVVTIKCNDCEVIQADRGWHFLGVQCHNCESFNTVVDRTTMIGQEAHNFLLRADPPTNSAFLQRRRATIMAPTPPFNQPNSQQN